jgi:hypothetical protein
MSVLFGSEIWFGFAVTVTVHGALTPHRHLNGQSECADSTFDLIRQLPKSLRMTLSADPYWMYSTIQVSRILVQTSKLFQITNNNKQTITVT